MATRNIIRKLTKSEAARIGGLARQKMYGDLGTPEGRARGGRNSQLTHRRLHTGFKQLRKVRFPKASNLLAEFIGIVMGDGHVGRYQVSICTNSITDIEHATYIYKLAKKLFDVPVSLSKKKESNALSITISSREVSRFLQQQGIPEGNKIEKGITIPAWVSHHRNYSHRLVRGLFDSDGCVFVDTHRIREKTYKNLGIAFANQELTLLKFFYANLCAIGLSPTQTSRFRVFLRRKRDIEKYFEIVGTSNNKHLSRYRKFKESK